MGMVKTNATHRGHVDLGGGDIIDGSDTIWNSAANALGLPAGGVIRSNFDTGNLIALESHSLADGGKAQLVSHAATPTGFCVVINTITAEIATFELDGSNGTVTEISDPQTSFTTTEDSDTNTNVYHDAGNSRFEINNEEGDTRTYHVLVLE